MKIEVQHRWRIQWCGKWTTTGYHCTEERIRREHPEAQVVPNTRRELQIAETPEEIRERFRQTDTSKLGSPAPGAAAYIKTATSPSPALSSAPSAY